MKTITREELKQQLDTGWEPTIIEVLAPEFFREFHLPRAISVPFDESFTDRIWGLIPDKTHPVVLYCMNTECPASANAATKLDEMGYENVFDYVAGKEDWKEAGLPTVSEHIQTV